MPENNNTQSEKTSSEIDVCSSYLKADIIAMINQDDGTEVRTAKPYGIGIDTAKDFIDVTVMVTIKEKCIAFYRRFDTDWNSLLQAKQWAVGTISIKSDPHIDMFDKNGNVSDTFHYCIESTGNYHKAILYAWNGMPSVVNPSIAGAAKKKTDRLDSRLLSIHDMTGIWNSSFIPSLEVEELRALIAEREYFSKMITRISARINNILLRFGFTIGRDGSVTKDSKIRNLVEQLISDNPDTTDMNICTNDIPEQVRSIIRELYNDYDRYVENEEAFNAAIIDKVKSMYWETDTGVLKGDEMLAILTTAPGIGEKTACLWLAQIVTPRRFPSANAVSAYCGTDPSLKISADKVVSTKKRGGNTHLHHALCTAASVLIRNKSEPFGRWGSNIYCRTNKWKKATNAVGRKLGIALYSMQKLGENFSYELYEMCRAIKVIDISIEEFAELTPGFKRYVKILKKAGISSTQSLVDEYSKCTFNGVNGLGKKFFVLIRDFIQNQKGYKQLHEEYERTHSNSKENTNE